MSTLHPIHGQWVVVTGASAGIGQAIAERCAEAGANLVLTARREHRLHELADTLARTHGVRTHTLRLDVRDRQAALSLGDWLTGQGIVPDVLINNAGLSSGLDKLHEGDPDDWDRMIDTNVKGLLYVSRAVVPLMVARNQGHVVNVSSIAAHQVYPCGNVYNASKFAVRALTEGLNVDLLGTRVRVSAISPGMVETEFSRVRFHGDEARAAQVYRGAAPLNAGDVADAVLYILGTPPHVNVSELVLLPTSQRNVYCLHRTPTEP